jgi:hypothetical protein
LTTKTSDAKQTLATLISNSRVLHPERWLEPLQNFTRTTLNQTKTFSKEYAKGVFKFVKPTSGTCGESENSAFMEAGKPSERK